MTDYTQVTIYTPKDSLLTGDANKKILGSQLDGELSLISTAIASKLNSSVVSAAGNPSASIGLTAVNGSATTYTRSDGAAALSQAISPTWTGGHTFNNPVFFPNGSNALPSMTFTSDPDTGIYRLGINDLGVAAGGVKVLDISIGTLAVTGAIIATSICNFQAAIQVGDGTVSIPGLGFLSDTDTGFYRIGTNNIGISAGGTKVADITTSTFNITSTDLAVNGTNITPTSSSFTATLTGMSGATTGTITYRKVGAIVTLFTTDAAIFGTSNTTAMTLTGLPAALIPSRNQSIPVNVVDNGVNLLGSFIIDNTGAISFKTFTVSGSSIQNVGVFTNSGTKGLPNGFSVTFGL